MISTKTNAILFLYATLSTGAIYAMETNNNARPTITMTHEEFSSFLNKYYSLPNDFHRKVSHTIMIPEGGAIFELYTKKEYYPDSIKLDIENGTKYIKISKKSHQVSIENDSKKKLATLHVICNAK